MQPKTAGFPSAGKSNYRNGESEQSASDLLICCWHEHHAKKKQIYATREYTPSIKHVHVTSFRKLRVRKSSHCERQPAIRPSRPRRFKRVRIHNADWL